MEECPTLMDIDEIRKLLIKANWDVKTVVSQTNQAQFYKNKSKNFIKINLVNIQSSQQQFQISVNEDDEGYDILNVLNSVRPNEKENQGLVYVIYRDI